MVAQTFNPSTGEAEVGRSLSSRPAWSTLGVLTSQSYIERPYLNKEKTKEISVSSRPAWSTLGVLTSQSYIERSYLNKEK
jgi:hypothetical protein